MILSQQEYIDKIAARTVHNTKLIRQDYLQRRDQGSDLHGVEFTRAAGPGAPATFFVSLSQDMTYIERFDFKLLIGPYTMLSPTKPPEVVPVDHSGFRVSVDGVDISAYLAAQYGGWIGGEGVYPSLQVDRNYDLLEVASDMYAEGNDQIAERIVAQGYKRIAVSGTSLFTCTLVAFVKHAHANR